MCPTLSKLNKATRHWHSAIIVYIILHLNLCTNVVFCLGQLLIVLCFCCKFCVSNKIIVYRHSFLFPIYRDMIRYLII